VDNQDDLVTSVFSDEEEQVGNTTST